MKYLLILIIFLSACPVKEKSNDWEDKRIEKQEVNEDAHDDI